MKINKEKMAIIIVSLCLLMCIILFNIILPKNDKKQCEQFELNDVVMEINLAINEEFLISDMNTMVNYMPVIIEPNIEFVFANTKSEQYFIIFKNLSSKKIEELEEYVKLRDNIEFETLDNYTYMIFSETYDSIIEGIIRSYVYCN